jgi:hypothetical protein
MYIVYSPVKSLSALNLLYSTTHPIGQNILDKKIKIELVQKDGGCFPDPGTFLTKAWIKI